MRVMLRVAYDGTAYSGWQLQPNAVTIEQRLNEALEDLFGVPMAVIGASRTDAGVHALGNAAVFDVDTRMPASKIAYALNTRLPNGKDFGNGPLIKDIVLPGENPRKG